jgi:prepilin-type N-terminal cleavage/methylation domain-containing protein
VRLRRAFTLIELLLATTIAGGAAAFMIGTLVRQQKFYASASAILDSHAQLRDAADVLTTDIRAAAVASLGLPVMRDSAIEMFSTVSSSVICTVTSSTSATLPPIVLASGTTLTSMLALPDTGDIALVYTFPPGVPDSGSWEQLRISSLTQRSIATACPASTGFTSAADAASGSLAFAVTFATPAARTLNPGQPVQFVRRGRYSLYRSSDNKWYLGYRRCNAIGVSSCTAIQPVSGPYDAYAAGGASGLVFRYFDAFGTQLAPAGLSNDVARVDVLIRGKSARKSNLAGDAVAAYRDSVVVSVSPRNRRR